MIQDLGRPPVTMLLVMEAELIVSSMENGELLRRNLALIGGVGGRDERGRATRYWVRAGTTTLAYA